MANPFKDWTSQMVEDYNRRIAGTGIKQPQAKPTLKDWKWAIGGNDQPQRKPLLNKTEARFLEILKAERAGEHIGVQTITLRIAHDCRYTPDFWCAAGGQLTFYEVKGAFIREDAMIKLKTAANQFPKFLFIIAQYKDGFWTVSPIRIL